MQTDEKTTATPSKAAIPEPYLTAKEAADFLHRSPKTLRNWRYEDKGPRYVRLGYKEIDYRAEDLQAFVEQTATQPFR